MSAIRYRNIAIRQPQLLKAKVEQAVAMRGMTVTSFINGTLDPAAEETINRARARDLTQRDSRALLAMLSKPRRASAALRAAAKQYRERTGG